MAIFKRLLLLADAADPDVQVWVREMASRRFECTVVTRNPVHVHGARDVVALRPGSGEAGWFTGIPALHRLATRLAPQWVHGHGIATYGLWAAASGLGGSVPVVLTASDLAGTAAPSGWGGAARASLLRWSAQRAALVTADAQPALDAVRALGATARAELVVPGVDTARWQPGKPAAGCLVAAVLAPGHALADAEAVLRAIAALRDERPQAGVQVQLVGDTAHADALAALAAGLRLTGAGKPLAGDAERLTALQRARLAVHVGPAGGAPGPLLEAMACGLPVVVAGAPPRGGWIDPDGGLVVPAGAEAVATALRGLLDDRSAMQTHGRRNRDEALQRAGRRQQMERMAVLYDALRLKAPVAPAP